MKRQFVGALAALVLLLPALPDARAQQAVPLPADTAQRLKGTSRDQIKAALGDVRMTGKAAAPVAPLIAELLKKGLDMELTQLAIGALGDTESEAGADVLAAYARHRALPVREAAVQSLGKTKGAAAVRALRLALSDSAEQVRRDAATGLGVLKAKEAVGDLFVALDHKVVEAAAAIGVMCAPAECDRLLGKLGQLPFDALAPAFTSILLRPEIGEDTKIKLIGTVREVGTADVNRFFRDAIAKWPKNGSARVKQSLDQAAIATAASPGGPKPQPEGENK